MSANARSSARVTNELDMSGWDPPDADLVEAAIAGDDQAFDVLVCRHRHTAVRVAAGIVGMERAEDVAQDSVLLAYQALRTILDRGKFSRWLCTIVRFRALRVLRSESRRVRGHVSLDESLLETVSDLACSPRQAEEGDEDLVAALDRIPPEYAEVIRLHFLHGLPHQKISEFVGVPISTVKWRCFRGKELLRDVMARPGGSRTRCDRSAVCAAFGRPAGTIVPEGMDPCPGCPGARPASSMPRSRDACGRLPVLRARAPRP